MTRILITGGSGFLGTNLVQYYLDKGDQVLNLDVQQPKNKAHTNVWNRLDILDRQGVHSVLRRFDPEVIFHMAARTDLDGESLQDYEANTTGVSNVVTAAQELSNLKRAIFASSMLVCKIGYRPRDESDFCPNTIYGRSKAIGEEIVRSSMAELQSSLIVRPTFIWGPWFDIPYKTFFLTVSKGIYLHPRRRTINRTCGFVLNIVDRLGCLATCDSSVVNGQTFYLADYEPIEIGSFARLIQDSFSAPPVREIPLPVLRVLARLGDLLKRVGMSNPPLTSFRLNNLLTDAIYDVAPLELLCPGTLHSTEEGVKITVRWLQNAR